MKQTSTKPKGAASYKETKFGIISLLENIISETFLEGLKAWSS